MKPLISILLVDDHPMIRDAMKLYFNDRPDINIKGEAENGYEGLEKMSKNHFDLVIMDLNMPLMNGLSFLEQIKEQYPEQKTLALSMINDASQIKKMIAMGVGGYVLKNSPKDDILNAIETIVKGDQFFSQEVMSLLIDNISGKRTKKKLTYEIPLTRREKEVLQLIMKEQTNQEIAENLFISVRTVEAHKRNLLEKTASKTVAGLAIYAMEKGLM